MVNRTAKVSAIAELLAEGAAGSGVALRIRGGCMAPALSDGLQVVVRRAHIALPGDVVVFRTSSDLTAHRVLGYWIRAFRVVLVTRGDRCSRHDGLIDITRVVGRVDRPVSLATRLRSVGSFLCLLASRGGRRS